MRDRQRANGVTLNAIGGTHVVTLGMNLTDARRDGCLGFALQREDHTEDERTWLRGMKTFEETDPGLGPGETVSSRDHPFQAFQWADYSAKPAHRYTYTAIPLTGSPGDLRQRAGVSATVETEPEVAGTHSVFFNRGAIASQEYARRFLNIAPDKLEGDQQDAAYRWLSRGLLEALQRFIRRATGPGFSLRGAIYEFNRTEVLSELREAHRRGADVRVVYDGIPRKSGAREPNEEAIAREQIVGLCQPRSLGTIMHNKFIVLLEGDDPIAVWTGSTNISENGLFGQLNVGHQVDDPAIARQYMDYWEQLAARPEVKPPAMQQWVATNSPPVPDPVPNGTRTLMSPRKGFEVLDAYAHMADVERPLFMTFAFGMDERFRKVYQRDDDVLRIALMEKEGNGRALEEGRRFIRQLRRKPNVVVAVGAHKRANQLDRWVLERADGIGRNVDWVHTKFMLIDPLSDDPIVVTGSANFSRNSTDKNDENMLVIRGDKRVADIYLGEFLRSYSHHAFRESLTFDSRPQNHLETDPQQWQKDHFDPTDDRFLRRQYFSAS
jgi:phosphatidylserine/phosphatidylglycerophosphate/cardiolipin synthase-like enzyme